ncbi:MAG: UbiX family flavin prenyltransferase [Candidatus Latescibacteria bacterium]|nr:UbiX family flavin prenyltransferase [Candidatus Latescibacterota bacterium]
MKRITLAITGASGAIYALRTLRALLIAGCHVDLIVSDYGWMLLKEEASFDGKRSDLLSFLVAAYGQGVEVGELEQHAFHDLASPLASGSARSDGMAVVPCTMKALSGIAHGASGNLIERAADVALKERRTLVLVPREAPFNLIHLRNMVAAAEAGAVILPAMPAFYQKPRTFDDLADFIAGRILNLLHIPHELFQPWKSEPEE